MVQGVTTSVMHITDAVHSWNKISLDLWKNTNLTIVVAYFKLKVTDGK